MIIFILIILKGYMLLLIIATLFYLGRHFLLTFNRIAGEQRLNYQDIVDSEMPSISVIIPMHNEERVAPQLLDLLLQSDYPPGLLEIIPVNDHSTDGTQKILENYAARSSLLHPIHRYHGSRGKPHALNDSLKKAKGEIVIIFDADYLPPQGILRDIAVCFKDHQIGAVMGRVIPVNTSSNFLTRCLDLERAGGYQVDQQARHNLYLIPQYGGTVAGFRREVVLSSGGFPPSVLAEDTELTFRLSVSGWKIAYANRLECYEESPESFQTRARQIRRWSRGHTQVLFRYFFPVIRSDHLTLAEKVDGVLILFVYAFSALLFGGLFVSLLLFFLGEAPFLAIFFPFMGTAAFGAFGNFAPFYQIGTAAFLDAATFRVRLLPFFVFLFLFNMWYISQGQFDAVIDLFWARKPAWEKTQRFRN